MRFSLRHHITREELTVYNHPTGFGLAIGHTLHFGKQSYRIEGFEHHTTDNFHEMSLIMVSIAYGSSDTTDTRHLGRYFYAAISSHKNETQFMRNFHEAVKPIFVFTADNCYAVAGDALEDYGLYHYIDGISAWLVASWLNPRETPPSILLSSDEIESILNNPLYSVG